jgi:alpha/beta superfamily hydrolase
VTKIARLSIPGPAGPLEALLEWNPDRSPRGVALICHPHPLYGGTMHSKVVFRAAKAALQAGLPALRFNFRGVGRSAGTFDRGVGERSDVRAALDYLTNSFPDRPAVMMGFSFGSWVGLEVGARDPRVEALVGFGIPIASYDMSYLGGVTKPKLIVQGTRDVYGPRDQVERFFASLAEPKRLHWIEGADHFFTGKLDELQAAVVEFLGEPIRT